MYRNLKYLLWSSFSCVAGTHKWGRRWRGCKPNRLWCLHLEPYSIHLCIESYILLVWCHTFTFVCAYTCHGEDTSVVNEEMKWPTAPCRSEDTDRFQRWKVQIHDLEQKKRTRTSQLRALVCRVHSVSALCTLAIDDKNMKRCYCRSAWSGILRMRSLVWW